MAEVQAGDLLHERAVQAGSRVSPWAEDSWGLRHPGDQALVGF